MMPILVLHLGVLAKESTPLISFVDPQIGDDPEAWTRAGFNVQACGHETHHMNCTGEVCVGDVRFTFSKEKLMGAAR